MKIKGFVIILFLFLFQISCSLYDSDPLAGGNLLFWKVSDEDSCVYLLGSMHFGKAEFYPLPSVVENAYKACDFIGVEIDLLETEQSSSKSTMLYEIMTSHNKAGYELNQETSQLLKECLANKGLEYNFFQNQNPGLLSMTIIAMETQLAGLKAQHGVDMHFLERAKRDNKPVKEFESIESQIQILFSDNEVLEGMLYNTLKEVDDFPQSIDQLTQTWLAGDAEAMNELLTSTETSEEEKYLQYLFGNRDEMMTDKIETALVNNEIGFIILGAGHFVNDNGIIRRLQGKEIYKIIKY